MKTVISVSGGRTSAYLAANYPADELVFALVRIEDEACRYPDEALRRIVEDRIQAPFIGTAEDDVIIHTILDLEQYLGRKIHWVTGLTFDEVVKTKCGWLPNKLHRICTQEMKTTPIFYWWAKTFDRMPVIMNIGYRANEVKRANKMSKRLNLEGLLDMKATFGKHPNGNNRWETISWQKPGYPLIVDRIYELDILNYWRGKPVRFAKKNNCVGCFNRDAITLRQQWDQNPNKMNWFASQEGGDKNFWKGSDYKYFSIKKLLTGTSMYPEDFSECDDGYCEVN